MNSVDDIIRYLQQKGFTSVEFHMDLASLDGGKRTYYFYASPSDDENFRHHIEVQKAENNSDEPFKYQSRTREPRRYN
ncbi:hypothetical protein POL82_27885 [Priestia aryabhattai]|uniref:hypothetical protein n=1 Tax=Priestia aryabhattai TaxID=412384 RepID=UPI00234F5526|nr:hypothetical protein [Priestia aryabhattai]MDC7767286.1 hypothetical protein [Priestia aryabhattai]